MSFDNSRLNELQNAMRAKMADNKVIADNFKIEEGTVVVSAEQKTAFDKNMADIREIKGLVEGLEAMRDADKWASEPQASVAQASAFASQAQEIQQVAASFGRKSVGEAFLASAEFKSLLQSGSANMPAPWQLKSGEVAGYSQKDLYSGLPTGTPTQFGPIQRDGIVVPPMRTRRVRDLFPARSTTAAIIEYFRMTGFTNNAAAVAERSAGGNSFGAKPQSSFTFVGEQAPVRTLAHWEAAHRNVLSDEPQLRSIIDNELMYGLRLQEDSQILNGNGSGENLTGVLQTSGIQSYNWSSGYYSATPGMTDTKADAIRRAATLSFLAYYEPTGVVLHPNDWEDIELAKDGVGSYVVAVSVAMGGEQKLWRIPVVDTPAIAEGTALVGAFGTGAQIYDREQASIRISEQHADFFVRNAIVILAEQRLALAVKRPESFVKVTFNNAPAA
jgi:HK97 family phage major capsid protein